MPIEQCIRKNQGQYSPGADITTKGSEAALTLGRASFWRRLLRQGPGVVHQGPTLEGAYAETHSWRWVVGLDVVDRIARVND